jgi:uncharacterized MAPEG superfamily protein
MTTPIACLLAFATWTILLVLVGIGPYRVIKVLTRSAFANSFSATNPEGPGWYVRLMRAHANCVENLPVFGAVVLSAHASGYASSTFDTLSVVYFGARVCQTIAHVSSGRNLVINIRFTFFLTQVTVVLGMVGLLVLHFAQG